MRFDFIAEDRSTIYIHYVDNQHSTFEYVKAVYETSGFVVIKFVTGTHRLINKSRINDFSIC